MSLIDYLNIVPYNSCRGDNMESCLTYIVPEAVEEYKEYHRTICFNLNRMILNVAFLKKAVNMQQIFGPCRNDYVISELYNNEFELLALRLYRTLYDEGADAITLPKLQSKLFRHYLLPQFKEELSQRLKSVSWKNADVIAARKRTEGVIPIFRNTFIAHSLVNDVEELSYSFEDAEKVIMAACDLFSKLDFGASEFYSDEEKANLNHNKEQIVCEECMERFFLYQSLSSYSISEIDCIFTNIKAKNQTAIQSAIGQINANVKHSSIF